MYLEREMMSFDVKKVAGYCSCTCKLTACFVTVMPQSLRECRHWNARLFLIWEPHEHGRTFTAPCSRIRVEEFGVSLVASFHEFQIVADRDYDIHEKKDH
jgi:hypothetical protein